MTFNKTLNAVTFRGLIWLAILTLTFVAVIPIGFAWIIVVFALKEVWTWGR